ncbi:MAG TPA: hypothetical protein VGV86_07165 [Acidimicrobiales bacterium]|nr:hypothetical protein [Acidimicrobiales bacterium]
MPVNATVQLPTLRCHRQDDGGGPSEPYLWTAAFWADATHPKVRAYAPMDSTSARDIFPDGVENGEDVAIPASIGRLTARLDDGGANLALFGVIAILLEHDETPEHAMVKGHRELPRAVEREINRYIDKNGPTRPTTEQQNAIAGAVRKSVLDAISDDLSWWEKLTKDQDDPVAHAFALFIGGELDVRPPVPLTLKFSNGSQRYEILGATLSVTEVPVDHCTAERRLVAAARSRYQSIQAEIRGLQASLGSASPSEKPVILREIARLRREELAPAKAALDAALRKLQVCEAAHQPAVAITT